MQSTYFRFILGFILNNHRHFLGLSDVAFPMELQSHCKVVQWVLYNAG